MHNHHIVELLTNIYNNPSQFAGYYMYEVKGGNLGKYSNSHSEQNHSSIVVYLG